MVGFDGFYLRDEVNLWWAIIRNRQYEPGFWWSELKVLLKNRFYPVSLQKAKEDEFVQLQQEKRVY